MGGSLANGITPFGFRIKKAPGIVPVKVDFHIKWNELLTGSQRKLIEPLLVEFEKVIAKLEVDSSVYSKYLESAEAKAKRLSDRNKHLNNAAKRN